MDEQTSRLGYYKKQDTMYMNQVTYRQMYTANVTNYIWFIGEQYNLWFVSNGVGDQSTGGILTRNAVKDRV